MILVIDMGNSMINLGFYKDDKLYKTYKTKTDKKKTLDEYILIFSSFFVDLKSNEAIEGCFISSVVPTLNITILDAVKKVFNIENIKFVTSGTKTKMMIKIDNPSELGADLASDCVGAIAKYGYPCVIVDLGTANKILFVDKQGAFLGGSIAPGLMVGLNALLDNASLLSEFILKTPKKALGRNTVDCLNVGHILGLKHQIVGIVSDVEKELGYEFKIILTGGNGRYVFELLPDYIYDENLTLDGVYQIYKYNNR